MPKVNFKIFPFNYINLYISTLLKRIFKQCVRQVKGNRSRLTHLKGENHREE